MVNEPHYHGHRQRLREKLKKDSTQLADYEILELILGMVLRRQDTKPLAKRLLGRFGSLRGVLDARPQELMAEKGVGPAMESFWLLLREFIARYAEAPMRERTLLVSSRAVADMARTRLAGCPHEEVWVAYMDRQNRLLAWERATRGTVNASAIYPRDLMEAALRYKASGLILVHNHPGGSARPSAPDVEVTKLVARSAASLGMTLVDHVIVTEEGHYSLKEDGLF
ncbi:DNA repair protein RadC [Oleidesulfovibrio alaskensis G20]|jgi:DNA repair protein RadC|uniref:DNA repair protein RadC n=1 Tax=Oleidesulfovibrio alaskensis (strain ATCC BAA-1058 / DSM 17464 / G20) TaxID=207559 RepID=Q30YK7_OLEA2|nr:DNA repair protein RadC [Oleidesulfovibrio alaskensis]ABB39239.1 DNA repair protein RadC [Oleidesulfovibrio alaskensis G20]MBG0772006.1 DNA repair protein RadC [Oleidesulfovibrio alaskensis]MBL3581756.1 DNA repair protein RadC [Oleidesulfovibrio alaskensis]